MKTNKHSPHKRILVDVAGFGLIILSLLIGWLPGPGGIPIFLAGLGLLSINNKWAKDLIDYIEKNRQKFEAKYLTNDPKVARIVDILCIILIIISIIAFTQINNKYFRYASIGPGGFGLILLILNQNRLDNFFHYIKNKRKHK